MRIADEKMIAEFKQAAEPLCAWMKANLNSHDFIVISSDQAKVASDAMSFPIVVND